MENQRKVLTDKEIENLVIAFINDTSPQSVRKLKRLATKTKPSTDVMADLLDLYADYLGLDQDAATAAWDLAAAVAEEGHPGGADDEFDLDAWAATSLINWEERTEDGDIAPLHPVTSLGIAVWMFIKTCHEKENAASLACGIMSRIRMIGRYCEVTQDEFDENFTVWWRGADELEE